MQVSYLGDGLLPRHAHLPVSTLSGLVSLSYLGEYYFCLLLG